MSEMQIEYWSLERLIHYAGNPRKNDHAVEQAAEAIREFGFRVPVVIRGEGEVIDGHLRLKAARHLGLLEVPVVRADDMTDAQVKAFRISVNRMAELADWDMDLLRLELEGLRELDFDLSKTGLDGQSIDDLLRQIDPTSGLTDPDEVPDAPAEPTTRPGDLWALGHHRLLCGDSTSADCLEKLMGGGVADMVFTDPPYNVNYQGGTKAALKIQNDHMRSDDLFRFLSGAFAAAARVVRPGSPIYVCYADSESVNFRRALVETGWLVKTCLIWVKNHFVLGRMDYHMRHEPILYGWRDGGAHRWYGARKQDSVWEEMPGVRLREVAEGHEFSISDGVRSVVLRVPQYEIVESSSDDDSTLWRVDKPLKNEEHPTIEPVEIPKRAILNSSKNGDRVLDLFLGSGTTLIAAEQSGRVCYGLELDPKYCDVIVRRWEKFTGRKAELV